MNSFVSLEKSSVTTGLPQGFSFTPWIESAFPKGKYLIQPGGVPAQEESVRHEECDAMIAITPVVVLHENNALTCGDRLNIVTKQPLEWGLSDFAVGVPKDEPDITATFR